MADYIASDSMMDLYGPCAWCGQHAAQVGPVCIRGCSEAYEYLRVCEWPIALGHSIARFVLAAEVDALVMEVRAFADWWMSSAEEMRVRRTAYESALSRLAQLARGCV